MGVTEITGSGFHKTIVVWVKSVQSVAMNDRFFEFCRYGFCLSVLLLFYGTLFPFRLDFSIQALEQAWSQSGFTPFWDVERGRIHSLPDMLSNGLLTVPLGFFGFLWFGRGRKPQCLLKWFVLGFFLGLVSEIIQLAIPSRLSNVTDALNNGLGCFAGAALASLFGSQIVDLCSGSLLDRESTYFLILVGVLTAGMLLPFDFGLDVSHVGSTLKQVWRNPWELGKPIGDEWILMAEFTIAGALAGSIGQARLIGLALALPFLLEALQFLVESHAPSARDLVMNFTGAAVGIGAARIYPGLIRPTTGFILINIALLAQALSPYHFAERSSFEWVPLVEYYSRTTGAALYDAMSGLLSYGLLAGFRPKKTTILWAVLLASGMETAQMFLATRFAGITDVIIAAIGAWAGYSISRAMPAGEPGYQK